MTRRLSGGTPSRFRLVDFLEERRNCVGMLGIFASGGQQEPPPSPGRDPDEPAPIGEPPPPIPVPNPEPPPMQL